MFTGHENIFNNLNQILQHIAGGHFDSALALLDVTERELTENNQASGLVENLRIFIRQNQDSIIFLQGIANGNLNVKAPDDPNRQNILIAQYKQIHSNLCHLTWQTQQIAKGDLNQKVSSLGEFSLAFNKMIENLREKKTLEDLLIRQNEELIQLNAQKDKFFSIIAHDLKNPFNSLLGFSELLVEQVNEKSYDNVGKYAGIILKSSQRALDLLTNLMDWARSQTGRMEFLPEYFELVDFITETSVLFDEIAGQKSISMVKKLPSKIPVYADKAMISTVVRNLISNAIKFTRPGGEIIITATENQTEVSVSVKDNGVGIPRDMLGKLFRIDENYTTSGTANERGTGLGLILCKEFIEKHGGKIWVESDEGQGSTFCFSLPSNEKL